MPVIAPSDTGSAALQGAQLTENFTRQMQGVDDMKGVELDRFNRRQTAAQGRQERLATIEQGLADREVQAAEMERALRDAGMADVAERFRRATQQQSFNAARRGLQGGSADIQQQAATEAAARAEAEQVAANAAEQRIQAQMQAAREAAGLRGGVVEMDPFEQMMLGQEQQGATDQTMIQGGIASANRLASQGRDLQRGAWAAGLGSFLQGAGNAGMASLIGGA